MTAKKKMDAKGNGVLPSFWAEIRNGRKAIAAMFLLDAAFVMALVLLGTLIGELIPSLNASSLMAVPSSAIWTALSVLLIYFFLVMLFYSFIKHIVLHYVRSFFVPSILDFGRFWRFYALNLCLFAIFGILIAIFAYFIVAVKQPYAVWAFLILIIPYYAVFFIVLHASQSCFHARGRGIFHSLAYGFSSIGKVLTCGRVIAKIIAVVVLLILLLQMYLYFTLRTGLLDAFYASLYYLFFATVGSSIGLIIAYILSFIGRIGFYAAALKGDRDVSPQH